jgi:phage host-nuclease inhibitor protein Gam
MRGEIGGIRAKIGRLRDTMDARFDAMNAKFSGKFEVLDRDIQTLSRHVFGADPH